MLESQSAKNRREEEEMNDTDSGRIQPTKASCIELSTVRPTLHWALQWPHNPCELRFVRSHCHGLPTDHPDILGRFVSGAHWHCAKQRCDDGRA